MKTVIVTDSTAYIPKDVREELNIHMIPLSVVIGGETYEEELDITAGQFYEELKDRIAYQPHPNHHQVSLLLYMKN